MAEPHSKTKCRRLSTGLQTRLLPTCSVPKISALFTAGTSGQAMYLPDCCLQTQAGAVAVLHWCCYRLPTTPPHPCVRGWRLLHPLCAQQGTRCGAHDRLGTSAHVLWWHNISGLLCGPAAGTPPTAQSPSGQPQGVVVMCKRKRSPCTACTAVSHHNETV